MWFLCGFLLFLIYHIKVQKSTKNHIFFSNLHDFKHLFNSPKNRKAEIYYKRKCDVGASKNAGQAFSTKRLSSHFLL